jgi:hypothetical protein
MNSLAMNCPIITEWHWWPRKCCERVEEVVHIIRLHWTRTGRPYLYDVIRSISMRSFKVFVWLHLKYSYDVIRSITSHRLNLTQGWKLVSSNIRGFMNDMDRSGIPDNFTTQSIWKLILILFLLFLLSHSIFDFKSKCKCILHQNRSGIFSEKFLPYFINCSEHSKTVYSKHPNAKPCPAFKFDLMPVPTIRNLDILVRLLA